MYCGRCILVSSEDAYSIPGEDLLDLEVQINSWCRTLRAVLETESGQSVRGVESIDGDILLVRSSCR